MKQAYSTGLWLSLGFIIQRLLLRFQLLIAYKLIVEQESSCLLQKCQQENILPSQLRKV